VFVAVDAGGGVFGAGFALGLELDDGGEEAVEAVVFGGGGRPVSGEEGVGPDEFFLRDDFQVAAEVGEVLSFGGAHDGAEDAAGAEIDLAIDGLPGCGGEPLFEVVGRGPGGPDEVARDIDGALKDEVESGMGSHKLRIKNYELVCGKLLLVIGNYFLALSALR
jgi:hypothetical protein